MKTDMPFIVTKRELEWLYEHQTTQILRQKIITGERGYLVMIKGSIQNSLKTKFRIHWGILPNIQRRNYMEPSQTLPKHERKHSQSHSIKPPSL